jgi:sugar phosphate isomerase/epimerase
LGDEAQRAGTIIGVENWRYPADPEQHCALLDTVDHPAVAATLDVGHIVYWLQRDGVVALCDSDAIAGYHQRLCALIDALGKRIVHVHVHDVQPEPLLDHRPIGSGIIDFPAIISRLDHFGYDGLLLLELAGAPPLPVWQQSVQHLVAAMKHKEYHA